MSKIILITGATSDIGSGLIRKLDRQCTILAHYHTNQQKLVDLKTETGLNIIPIQADFGQEGEVLRFIEQAEGYGVPHAIVHLAAPNFENIRFKDLSWERMQAEWQVSFGSIFLLLHHFLPRMAALKRGKVIGMLSSVTQGVPPKALAQYTSVKYALLGLMRSLAAEYADKHITVNCISPSMVETGFLANINEKVVELAAQAHPLKRNAQVGDIVPALLFLLQDDAVFINGVNIPVTGGSNF